MKIRILISAFLVLAWAFSFAQPSTPDATTDTITSTEVDTVELGYLLDARGDLYTVSYQIDATQLSGTTNLTVKHMVSNAKIGNAWVITSDSLDLDGTSNGIMTITNTPAARSALQITGTGAQSSLYVVRPRIIRRE